MNPGIFTHRLVHGPLFWAELAHMVLARLESAQTPHLVVLVPVYGHAKLLRQALAEALKVSPGRVVRLPRILTPSDWLRSLAGRAIRDEDDLPRRVELFEALRQTDWLASALGGHGGLWSLTRQLLTLGDELSWAAWLRWGKESSADAAQIEQQLRTLIRNNYAAAWQACSPEAELVLSLWRASFASQSDTHPMLQTVRALEQARMEGVAVLALMPQCYASHEQALLERYARHASVEHIVIDVPGSLPPALAHAWPECLQGVDNQDVQDAGGQDVPGLRARADTLKAKGDMLTQLELVPTHSLEEEAVAAASRVLDWLDAGKTGIGLVVLDRVVARRVRALLERAEVLVQDETGWKLSTSSAAGMLMRWLQLCSAGAACETSVLLDWLKSPFVWTAVADKPAVLDCIESTLRRYNIARGWVAILDALQVNASSDANHSRARSLLEQVWQQSQALHGRQTLARHFSWLEQSLTRDSGGAMRAALEGDLVGRSLLDLLDQLSTAVRHQSGRYSLSEWRDLLADALENTTFRDQTVTSPVVFCSLQGARLRHFDALLIVGADAKNFALTGADTLFLTPGLRAELGLRHRDAEARQQLLDLALLLSAVGTEPRPVVVSWQASHHGETNALAPPLERLSLLHKLAFGDDLRRSFSWAGAHCVQSATAQTHAAPAPRAPSLVPNRLSASAYERLISCPYRYFVQSMLGWVALDEVSEDAEKRDYGELLHRILQIFHDELNRNPQTGRDALIEQLRTVSEASFAPLLVVNGDYLAWHERWLVLIPSYIDWLLKWSDKGWHFHAAEVRVSTELMLENQSPLTLFGRIDRIDQADASSDGNDHAIALIDYKTQSKEVLKKKLKAVGEDVQLPFYRLLLPEANAGTAFYLSVDKGAVEAVQAEQSLDALSAALERRIRNDFTRLKQGAALPANGIDRACQYCDARGLCRKGHWTAAPDSQA